jgi:hypothetical protein
MLPDTQYQSAMQLHEIGEMPILPCCTYLGLQRISWLCISHEEEFDSLPRFCTPCGTSDVVDGVEFRIAEDFTACRTSARNRFFEVPTSLLVILIIFTTPPVTGRNVNGRLVSTSVAMWIFEDCDVLCTC